MNARFPARGVRDVCAGLVHVAKIPMLAAGGDG